MLILWILGFSVLGSIGAIAGAALLLTVPTVVRDRLVPLLISYATGTLLGAAFLGVIPTGVRQAPAREVLMAVLAGIVLFFILEKPVLWRHCQDSDCEVHGQAAPLILIGDAFHNLVDGVVIAAAFLTSVPLGLATAIAVIAHETPQEIGDFAILPESGYSKNRALLLNTLSTASFIYIATADLLPNLHRKIKLSGSVIQVVLLLAGVMAIAFLKVANG